ncbi:MAG TPA: winged helix-turn-helix transcriptional regulator [Acidimicrobiales bacterium]|nr:winged helix-turn-helix transcriptional regulator [Acidimicrobiales bacterium]
MFAERWTPIIVRNLLLGCTTFGEILEGAPGIPRSLLAQRLRDLERYGLLHRRTAAGRRGRVYALTEAGLELAEVCDALGRWGARWLDVAPMELDPGIVLWAVAKCMDRARLPETRITVRFDVKEHPTFWLVVRRPEPELCRTHPGGDEDVIVATDVETLARWHMGELTLVQAAENGRMRVVGSSRLVRALQTWGGQSPFKEVKPASRAPSA